MAKKGINASGDEAVCFTFVCSDIPRHWSRRIGGVLQMDRQHKAQDYSEFLTPVYDVPLYRDLR